MATEQLEKLPKWAQIEINRLKRNNEGLQAKLNQINGAEETNTFITEGMDERPLPKNANLRFRISKNKIEVRIEGEYLSIHSSSDKGRLAVLPSVSNAIYLAIINDL